MRGQKPLESRVQERAPIPAKPEIDGATDVFTFGHAGGQFGAFYVADYDSDPIKESTTYIIHFYAPAGNTSILVVPSYVLPPFQYSILKYWYS